MTRKPHLALALLVPMIAHAAQASIQLDQGKFLLTGVPGLTQPVAGWSSIFTVSTAAHGAPPMLGAYAVENGALVFHPRFPLSPGVRYRAVYRAPESPPIEKLFDGPFATPQAATQVTQVYPSADLLPANQLKLYIYFSAPMQRGGVWTHIHLLDEGGQPVTLAFLEIDQELWDPAHRRLTVLFDPGRIKRGVGPEREIGPPIVPGKRYTLQIDRDLLDAQGQPLAGTFRKEFRGGPAMRAGIDLKDWRITAPAAGSTGPLVVDFARPLDYALLEHAIAVAGPGGLIPGRGAIANRERQWSFTPAQPWKTGDYELSIDPSLEDLAGNRIGRPFDVDLSRPERRVPTGAVPLRFAIGTR